MGAPVPLLVAAAIDGVGSGFAVVNDGNQAQAWLRRGRRSLSESSDRPPNRASTGSRNFRRLASGTSHSCPKERSSSPIASDRPPKAGQVVRITAGLTLSLWLVSLPRLSLAQPATVIGPGVHAYCGNWLAYRKADAMEWMVMWSWALGFLSGTAMSGGDDSLRGASADRVAHWLDQFCRAQPHARFLDAVNAFIAAARKP